MSCDISTNNIRIARKAKGLTMKELGTRIGVAESTISQYENGKRQPDNNMLLLLARELFTTIDFLLGDEHDSLIKCRECGLEYNPANIEDIKNHSERHKKWEMAVKKFGFCYTYIEREKMKVEARNRIDDGILSDSEAVMQYTDVFKALFSRSLEANFYDLNHPNFTEYVGMLLNQETWHNKIKPNIFNLLCKKYPPIPGIEKGTYYYAGNDTRKRKSKEKQKQSNIKTSSLTAEALKIVYQYNELEAVAKKYSLSDADQTLIEKYVNLDSDSREIIIDFIKEVAAAVADDEDPYANFSHKQDELERMYPMPEDIDTKSGLG